MDKTSGTQKTRTPAVFHVDNEVYSHYTQIEPVIEICPMCNERKVLVESHINPRWAWINAKVIPETGTLVSWPQWFYLLCESCDQHLGIYEQKLTYASRVQPKSFQSVRHFREISIALMAVLWKASLANKLWTGRDSWSADTDEHIRKILFTSKMDKEEGLKLAATAVHWQGVKFFSNDDSNPYAMHALPQLGESGSVLGMTYLAGVRWTVMAGKGTCSTAAYVWNDEEGIYANLENSSHQDLMRKIAAETNDEDPCPCGRYKKTGKGEDTDPIDFVECCKNGWLSEPFTPGYYVSWPKEGPYPMAEVTVYIVEAEEDDEHDIEGVIARAIEKGHMFKAGISTDQLGYRIE